MNYDLNEMYFVGGIYRFTLSGSMISGSSVQISMGLEVENDGYW